MLNTLKSNLSPRVRRDKRLEQYREAEDHEWMEAVLAQPKERNAREHQIDRDLLSEKPGVPGGRGPS
jgi:hypothetical protein